MDPLLGTLCRRTLGHDLLQHCHRGGSSVEAHQALPPVDILNTHNQHSLQTMETRKADFDLLWKGTSVALCTTVLKLTRTRFNAMAWCQS